MKILKNSEKFSVFRAKDKKKKFFILKIANKKPEKIFKEINLIKKLCTSSVFFKKTMPEILDYGYFKKGLFKSKGFYKQKYIAGLTFSQLMKNKNISKKESKVLTESLYKKFIDVVRNSQIKKKNKPISIIKKLIFKEYKNFSSKYLFSNLEKSKNIYINGKKYKNINFYLKKIFDKKKIKKLDNKNYFLSKLGHWNFHGGNIIFPQKKNYQKFYLIDPDATWSFNDPFFSLARFIYTYPHDTMEYNKYFISSDDLKNIQKKNKLNFNIGNLWEKNTLKNYKFIFSQFDKNNFLLKELNKEELIRLNLSLILCFIRGINSNFEIKINFLNNENLKFQNKGIYLYLLTILKLEYFSKN
jgi:hypothetical protein